VTLGLFHELEGLFDLRLSDFTFHLRNLQPILLELPIEHRNLLCSY